MKNPESAASRPSLAARIRHYANGFSIRSRIFAYFLLFTALLLALLWLFQTVLLEQFYRFQKTSMLSASMDSLAGNINNPELESLVERISQQNDVCVLILDEKLVSLASADASPGCLIHHMGMRELQRFVAAIRQENRGRTVFRTFQIMGFRNSEYRVERFAGRVPPPENRDVKSMIAAKRASLADGREAYILLNAIITPVNATVETLRHQLFFITVILVLLSFLLSLVLSKRITQPIVATTLAAKELTVGRFAPRRTRISYREVVQLNRQLTQTAQDLRKVEGMQRELIANISHDLRTPLTLIQGYAEAMRDIPGENNPGNMQVIIDETKRLSTLVNAVLDYSASKNGKESIRPKVFDLTAGILEILGRYQKLIQQDGYRVDFQYERHVKVMADEVKVGQVVYNLVNNALTYAGEDKTVTLRQTVENGQIKIEVSDSGEGIDPQELPHIWSRYYRGGKPHKRAAIGTGLGLSIVQSILENHRLEYGVASEKGKGTTFWFLIPAWEEEDQAPAGPDREFREGGEQCT